MSFIKETDKRVIWLAAVVLIAIISGACATKSRTPAAEAAPPPALTLDTLPLGNPALKDKFMMVGAGKFYSTAEGGEITFDQLIDKLSKVRVVYLGETHTSMAVHQNQTRIIKALYERNPKIKIGMEFFQRQDDDILNEWSANKISEEELIRKTGWYAGGGGYNFGYYRPFMDFAREKGLPVIGINIPRSIVHHVSRNGLDSLTEEEKKIVGEVDVTNKEHRKLIEFYFGGAGMGHGSPESQDEAKERFNRMYAAQSTWDEVMADSIKSGMEDFDGIFVVIVGSGHTGYNLGINRRLYEQYPEPYATVMPVQIDKDGEPVRVVRSLGDFVMAYRDDIDPEYYPRFSLSASDKDGKVVVGMLLPGSFAMEKGIQTGDVITSLDGKAISDVTDLRLRLAAKKWGEKTELGILRGEENMTVDITPIIEKD